jgi:UDP-N-acetylmuramoyl-L-alanyl-D-glutamate--2,6-diaminopimelate ligase
MEKKFFSFWNKALAEKTKLIKTNGCDDAFVSGLEYDSRLIKKNNLYFALPGLHTDGHNFINSAIENGASVIVHQTELENYNKEVLYIRVHDSRFAMSSIADAFYDSPSKKLAVIGVTGTEGKSTTVYLIFQLLRMLGKKAGFISTVQYSVDGSEHWNSEHQTTPEAVTIHKRLFEMVQSGCKFAVIESSSHGLSPKTNRLGDVSFDAGVFTNVTHEHLEFHGTFEQYRKDKSELFRALPVHGKIIDKKIIPSFGVTNADDPSSEYFVNAAAVKVFSFSTKGAHSDLSIKDITSRSDGNDYKCVYKNEDLFIKDNLPGAFNAGNVLASMLVVSNLLELPLKEIASYIPKLLAVRGRMTSINKGQNFEVLIDYAHTPSSFEAIFPPLRKRIANGQIISLFGSAGERDTKKRKIQGRIASEYSDIIILTDEDPRGEDPISILEEIATGITNKTRNKDLFLIPDREEAIKKAFSLANKNSIVLLLGKGHENSIIYSRAGKTTISYDEIKCAENALQEMQNRE